MKKFKLFAASLGLMTLAACSNSEDVFNGADQLAQFEQEDNAVKFGVYLGQQAQTRAGWAGDIDNKKLKDLNAAGDAHDETTGGFGVFAYYTGTTTYDGKNGAHDAAGKIAPNFMYNEKVYYDFSTSKWKYDNIKYWPNEIQNGDVDKNANPEEATTAHTNGGKVTFFAYAPYVSSATGTSGITNMSANNVSGDPKVTYTFAKAGKNVDLLWGTYGSTSASVVGGTLNQGVVSTATTVSQRPVANRTSWPVDILSTIDGTPTAYRMNADLVKQENDGTVDFAFKHALSKVGGTSTTDPSNDVGLQIVLDADDVVAANAASNTVVTVEDIKITTKPMSYLDDSGTEQTGKYITGGTFNLATGKWENLQVSDADADAVVHELTTFGTDVSGSLNADIAEPTSVSSMSGNPKQVNGSVPGVTGTAKPVYGTATSPMLFIPGCKPKFEIEITYYVRSYDENLNAAVASGGEGTWTKVKQTIKKTVEFGEYTKLNNRYSLLIHLGITSVKFTASVSAWEDNATGIDTDDDGVGDSNRIDLPLNVE